MTNKLIEAHKLYPNLHELEWGEMHNDDPFFRFMYPEDFKKHEQKGWGCRGCEKEIRGHKISFVECVDHADCWAIAFEERDGSLEIAYCEDHIQRSIEDKIADFEKDDPFLNMDVVREKVTKQKLDEYEEYFVQLHANNKIISAKALERKITNAQPSSLFFHPFEGFEKVDAPTVPMSWTVQDLIPDKSIGAIYGERESLKSFLALDLALSVATGTPFNGAATRQGSVLYFAPEGSTGIGIRRDAWKAQNGWENKFVPFYSRGGSFSFTSQHDRDYLADLLAFAHDFAPRLVIFDTLGQSLGDADENSASDINKIARFLNDLKLAHDCSFLWVDHSGHESKRVRGSSAKGGALDFEYYVKRKGDQIEVTNTKMKDAPRSKSFTMEAVPSHGSLVLKHVAPNPSHADLLIAIITEASDHCEKRLRASFYEKTTASTQEAKQKAFQRSVGKLIEEEKIAKVEVGQSTKLVLKTSAGHTHPPL